MVGKGGSNGLRVAKKTGRGFEVRELGKGTSSVVFSFRIVAQRKDVEAPRLPKVKLDLPEKLRAPKMSKPPQRAGRQ